MKQRSPLFRLALLAAAVLLFAIGYYWGGKHKPAAYLAVSAVQLGTPIPLKFTGLATITGEMFDPVELHGHWALLILAPNEPAVRDGIDLLISVRNRLADRPEIQAAIRFVLFQPASVPSAPNATPAEAGFVVLFANRNSFSTLSRSLGNEDEEATGLWLLNPDTQAVALFTPTQDAATIAADIQQFVDNH